LIFKAFFVRVVLSENSGGNMRTFISYIAMIMMLGLMACSGVQPADEPEPVDQEPVNVYNITECRLDRLFSEVMIEHGQSHDQVCVGLLNYEGETGVWVILDDGEEIDKIQMTEDDKMSGAHVFGLLNGIPLVRLTNGVYWQVFFLNRAHPVRSATPGDHMEERTHFEVHRDGVVVIRQTGYPPVGQIIFAHQFGENFFFSSDKEREWKFVWDDELSLTRQCKEVEVEREMDPETGEIFGLWVTCDLSNEMVSHRPSHLGIH
jgi:hypothetical protein